jgi:RNA polymerase sigma factor (sigma-70 family)
MEKIEQDFLELVNQNRGILHKISKMYTNTYQDKADLEQEMILQLWKSFESFNYQSKFSSWMYRVVLNTAMLHLKKEKKRVTTVEITADIATSTGTHQIQQDRLQIFYTAAQQLTKVERAIVFLYMEGLSHKEIGENLKITEGNARVKLNRTKNKLQQIIATYTL